LHSRGQLSLLHAHGNGLLGFGNLCFEQGHKSHKNLERGQELNQFSFCDFCAFLWLNLEAYEG